jgi:hypothetical protein
MRCANDCIWLNVSEKVECGREPSDLSGREAVVLMLAIPSELEIGVEQSVPNDVRLIQ